MDKFLPFVMVLLIATTSTIAQNEANIWYFGHNAGLDFNTNPPTPLLDGILNTDEGCASIADPNGELLFYTDGTFVWNKNHEEMPNGFGLLGHKSSTQSGVIIPKPGTNNIYYVFTVDFTAGPGGIAYSEVDMNLDGGLGDVTAIKNIQLVTPACEKITAVLHENEQDIWVVGHSWESDNFLSWRVTPNGVNTTPVISAIGSVLSGNTFNSIGYMKASATGDRIAAAHWSQLNRVEVFDFNNATGQLTNPIVLTGFTQEGGTTGGAYGVEFAPNEPILYVSERTYGGYIYQYDLSSGDESTINNSQITLATYNNRWGALQLGPDGKIYIAKRQSEYLAVINEPDQLGFGCDFQDNSMYLGGKLSWIGLPSFIQSYFIVAEFTFEGICPANPTTFTIEVPENTLDSVLWNFGDPASGLDNTSTSMNPSHTFSNEGTFEITLIVYSGANSDTTSEEITLTYPELDLGPDHTVCADEIITLNGTTLGATYLWSDNSTNSIFNVTEPGVTWLEITVDGCPVRDTVLVNHLALPQVDIENDPTICENEIFTFDATTANAASYIWNNNTSLSALQTATPGEYTVTVTSTNGCTAFDASTLTVSPLPVFSLGANEEVCVGENYLLDASVGGNTVYLWQDGSTNSTFNVTSPGVYTVQVTTDGCPNTDEVEIYYTDFPVVDLGADTVICPDEEIFLDAYFDDFTTYTWQNNSNLPTFTVTEPGVYTVNLENICGTATDEILIGENTPPLPISIGNDTIICRGEPYLLDATNDNTTHYLWHDGSSEPTILVEDPGFYAVTWANNCGFVTAVIEVENRKCECIVNFPNAFSPDGNGSNEKFNTVSPCLYDDYNLKIFTRWGELVFETNDPSIEAGWDGTFNGKDLPVGVYVYTAEYSHEFDKGRVSGDVTIVR